MSDTAPGRPSAGQQRGIIEAFSRAINREASVLSQRPDLLWQQLYNRLQWDYESVQQTLAPEVQRRAAPGARPWAWLRTPIPESSALIRTINAQHAIWGCAITHDGSSIVSATAGEAQVWDLRTGRERAMLPARRHQEFFKACAVAPDGSFVVLGCDDHTLRIFDTATWKERTRLQGHTGSIITCAVSPDGSFIVSAAEQDERIIVWNVLNMGEAPVVLSHPSPVRACAISFDASFIVSALAGGVLTIWDVGTRQTRASFQAHYRESHMLDWGDAGDCGVSPDGSFVVSCGFDRTLKIWDTETWLEQATLRGHSAAVTACTVSPDGTFIVSASADHTLKIWDVGVWQERGTLQGHADSVWDCAISPDSRCIVSGGKDGTLRIWDVHGSSAPVTAPVHGSGVTSCGYNRQGSLSVSASYDETLRLWDGETAQAVRVLHAQTAVTACAFTPDGGHIISGELTADPLFGSLTLWSASTGRQLWRSRERHSGHRGHELNLPLVTVTVSPDGSFIVSAAYGDDRVIIWNAADGTLRQVLSGPTDHGADTCAISPDGSFVVSRGQGCALRVWDIATRQERQTLQGHKNNIQACTVSPDASFIVSASSDNTLKIWDARTGQERLTLAGHTDGVDSCAVSPDGKLILSGSRDHTVRTWDANTGGELVNIRLPGEINAVGLHPHRPQAVVGDSAGNLHLLTLLNIAYGPIYVTPVRSGDRLTIQCPRCQRFMAADDANLGQSGSCAHSDCGCPLRVNPFVIAVSKAERAAAASTSTASPAEAPAASIHRRGWRFWKRG